MKVRDLELALVAEVAAGAALNLARTFPNKH